MSTKIIVSTPESLFLVTAEGVLDAPQKFASQEAAEGFANGLAAGLRFAGRGAVEVHLDVPDLDVPDPFFDDLDMFAMGHGLPAEPEMDPIERRLIRDCEAAQFRASHLGLD